MRTAGVDLSAAAERTAAATIEWRGGRAQVAVPSVGLDDAALLDVLAQADWVGIDAPFGWPRAMVDALGAYASEGRWPEIEKDEFRYRRTDRVVREAVLEEAGRRLAPLSVSSDRIALTARRLAGLREAGFRASGRRFDRAGGDRVLEVYPAAALLLWGLERVGYKGDAGGPEHPKARAREQLLAGLQERAPWLQWEEGARDACLLSDDALDAVLAALIARAGALGLTAPPQGEDLALADSEGWVHLPARDSLAQLAGARVLSLVRSA